MEPNWLDEFLIVFDKYVIEFGLLFALAVASIVWIFST